MANKTKFERNLEEKLNVLADKVRPLVKTETQRHVFNLTGFFYSVSRFNILQAVAQLSLLAIELGIKPSEINEVLE